MFKEDSYMSIDTVLKCKCNANWKKSSCQIIWITSEPRRKILDYSFCQKQATASLYMHIILKKNRD